MRLFALFFSLAAAPVFSADPPLARADSGTPGTFNAGIAVGRRFAVGVKVPYERLTTGTIQSSFVGGLLTGELFFGDEPFTGLFALVGGGGVSFSVSDLSLSESALTAIGLGGFGWYWRPGRGAVTLRVFAGGQYVAKPELTLIETGFSGVLPSASASFGLSF